MLTLQPGPGKAPATGGELAYLVVGEGPPIAATHPYSMPRQGYQPLPGFTTITVWPRDFGASSRARGKQDYAFWQLADDLDAVRRHLGLERWVFWGTSMGGFTGLIYALKYQPTLAALILDSTAASYHYRQDPDSIWPAVRASEQSAAFRQNPSAESLGRFFMHTLALQGAEDPAAAWAGYTTTQEINPYALAECIRRLDEFDTRSRLAEIRTPTLVLSGGKDLQCSPAQAQILADGIPAAVLKGFPETGHGVIRYNPPGALETVRAFIASALERGTG